MESERSDREERERSRSDGKSCLELLLSNSRDPLVEPVRRELESRLAGDTQKGSQESTNVVPRGGTTKPLPFEFRALELCLELASKCLEIEVDSHHSADPPWDAIRTSGVHIWCKDV